MAAYITVGLLNSHEGILYLHLYHMDTKWLMTTNEDIIYYDEVHVYETSFSRKSNAYTCVCVWDVYYPFGLI